MPRLAPSEQTHDDAQVPAERGFVPVLEDADWRVISCALKFTDRESQIIRALVSGLNQDALARELRISPNTVHTHLDRVYRKLKISSRFQLLLRVFAEYTKIS